MGIFVFTCDLCGLQIENIESYEESEEPHYCACQPGTLMRKEFPTNVSAKYNCGGFYATDYKEHNKGQPASKIRKKKQEWAEKWGSQ